MLFISIDRVGVLYYVIISVCPHPRPRIMLGGYILPRGTDVRREILVVLDKSRFSSYRTKWLASEMMDWNLGEFGMVSGYWIFIGG
ncbi:hypothetical protein EYC80_003902 [Monilinia laxa]|uniref:Uncharacterized protein n=1 Tax=Monilinia laxa TaxID=61186 RepID=A0A5N6KLF2_MONLA|nr:hypothetical protein EYC80_003902 [Monilinia laxa]